MSILLVSIFIVLSPVSAATYNVYPGDDIEAIIEGASAGDTIYIHAGTHYPKGTISMPADHITIIGDDPFTTILDGTGRGDVITTNQHNYMVVRNLTIQNAYDDAIEVQNYCEVTNCIIKNCDDGIVYDTEGHHNTIKNCIVSDCRGDGIQVYDYNTIENCISFGNGGDGFGMGNNSTLKNCLSYGNGDDGFQDFNDCIYINCTAANNDGDGFYSISGGSKYENCISVGNTEYGFNPNLNGSFEIIYSNAWGNGDEDYYAQDPDIGSISVDPKFVDGINSFYLSPGSPCVDSGSDTSAALGLYEGFTTRTDGKWDTGTVDMGFHYSSSRGPPSSLPMDRIMKILKENQQD